MIHSRIAHELPRTKGKL